MVGPAGLSPAQYRSLENVSQAKGFGDLRAKGAGRLGAEKVIVLNPNAPKAPSEAKAKKVAELVAHTFIQLNKQYKGNILPFDDPLARHVFKKLANNDPNLLGIIQTALPLLTKDKARDLQLSVGQLTHVAVENTQLIKEREWNLQLGKPQAHGVSSTFADWSNSLEQSQGDDLALRAQLYPVSGAGTATGNYRIPSSLDGRFLVLVKPANQGLSAKDNPSTAENPDMAKTWGILPGSEAANEHRTCSLMHMIGCDTNIPDLIALNLSHPAFGPPDLALLKLSRVVGVNISTSSALKLLVSQHEEGGPISGKFEEDLYQFVVDSTVRETADLITALYPDLVFPPGFNLQEAIKDCVANHEGNQFYQALANVINGQTGSNLSLGEVRQDITFSIGTLVKPSAQENTETTFQMLRGMVDKEHHDEFKAYFNDLLGSNPSHHQFREKMAEYINSHGSVFIEDMKVRSDGARDSVNSQYLEEQVGRYLGFFLEPLNQSMEQQVREIGAHIFNDLKQTRLVKDSSLCSVQEFKPNCVGMESLSQLERASVNPQAYGRIQVVDQLSVGRDRNAGNILFQSVSTKEITVRLNEKVQGLGDFIELRLNRSPAGPKSAANNYQPVVPLAEEIPKFSRAEALLVETTAHQILADYEAKNGPVPSHVEIDVHLRVGMHYRNSDTTLDAIPIDNGITFPDPQINPSYFGQRSNNAWIEEPQARAGRIPPRTAKQLAEIDLRNEILPRLIEENRQLALMTSPTSNAAVSFNQNQQALWFISARILQLGAKSNKTFFEMGLMKDTINFESREGKSLSDGDNLPTPLSRLYAKYGQISPDKIDLKALDKDIKAEYERINHTFGSFEDGFAKLPEWLR